jgi:hypothetical protein
MRKARQIPLAFNNDRDISRIRAAVKSLPDKDLKLLLTAGEHELSQRAHPFRKDETKEALAGFLDKISFDYFCTFTTRGPISQSWRLFLCHD